MWEELKDPVVIEYTDFIGNSVNIFILLRNEFH